MLDLICLQKLDTEKSEVFDVLLQQFETNIPNLFIAVSGEFNLRWHVTKNTLELAKIFFHLKRTFVCVLD